MTTTNLTVRFSTLAGQDAQRTYTGDFGFVPAPGMVLRPSANAHLTVARVIVDVGGAAEAIADARTFEDVTAARQFATALTTRMQALGFTVAP